MPGIERRDVGGGKRLVLRTEFAIDPGCHRLTVPVEHPECKAERPHVFAAQGIFGAEPVGLHGVDGEARDVQGNHLEPRERPVFQRVGVIAGLAQVTFAEGAGIGDDQAARAQISQIHLERRRVHRNQHIGFIAAGFDGRRAEVDLEGRDAEGRALRRTDFRRVIRESGERVAGQSCGEHELASSQLHAIA